MVTKSSIEWTETTWNPVYGCTKCSPGCRHCYAERMAARLAGMAKRRPERRDRRSSYVDVINDRRRWNGQTVFSIDVALDPLHWRTPRLVFVNSMSDLFHEQVAPWQIELVFTVMLRCPQHTFQVLTKRAERLEQLAAGLPWPGNVWMGVSIENRDYLSRVRYLCHTPAAVKFLSIEPLLGPTGRLELTDIDWVIVGGESGSGARPMRAAWVREVRDQCLQQGVSFFFKQWGRLSNNPSRDDPTAKENGGKAKGGRMLDGRMWDEMPG